MLRVMPHSSLTGDLDASSQLEGAMEGLIERKYVTTAPTTGTDGYEPKIDSSAKPFLAPQVGENATERAVNRALKKGGKR